MKYKALIEKLDWKGRVVRKVREFEDEFRPDMSWAVRETALNGKVDLSKLETPKFAWFIPLAEKVAPALSENSFKKYELGVRVIAGEFYPGLGIQLV